MPNLEQWPRKLNRLMELGEAYSEAKSNLENLRNVKATIIAVAMAESNKKSVAAQRAHADASPSYMRWCEDYACAVREAEKLRLRLEAAKLWFEMIRTEESSRREEMRLSR